MTSAGDPFARFTDQLPHFVAVQLHRTDAAMDALMLAMSRGWPIDQLAREVSRNLADATDIGAVVLARMRLAGKRGPDPAATMSRLPQQPWRQPLPWCGVCDDPRTRWRELPDGGVTRCPDCWTPPPL